MKTTLTLASAATFLAVSLTGVAGAGASSQPTITPAAPKSGTVTIELYTYYGPGNQETAVQMGISAFEKKYPNIKVVYDYSPGSSAAAEKLVTLEAANKTPNIIVIDQSDLYEFYPRLVPMSTFFPPSFIAHFDAGGTDSATYAGIEYGLQVLGANDTALVYNKADFAQAGITSPPKTWSQLLTDATKLTVPSQNRYGFGVSGTQTEESSWQFEPFLWSNGGNLDDLNSPASVKALSFWQELVKDKVMPSATASWTQADVQDHFAVNDLAMEINGPWQVPCLEVPSVCLGSAKSSVKPVPWGVAPIPTRLTSQKLIVPIGGETWEIGKSTTAQEAASALLIQFLTDDTALNVAVTHTMGYMPAIKTETAAYDRSFPLYSAWASELRNGIPREYGKGQYGAVSALLQVAIGQVLTLSESPQAALNTAAAGVKAIPTS